MAQRYSTFYSLADFIERCVPKRGGSTDNFSFIHSVFDLLKRLDEIQRDNIAVTLSISAGGGIWVVHHGLRLFMIEPGQKSLNIIAGLPGTEINDWLKPHAQSGSAEKRIGTDRYVSWKINGTKLDIISKFIASLSGTNQDEQPKIGSHPRAFPAAARQFALEAFQANGGFCPGHQRQPHRLNLDNERIEFDHILPYAKGGASTDWNIQVLCQDCNRLKRARAD